MMSFKHASDATYIAQLLGRMVRTPMQMHKTRTLSCIHCWRAYLTNRLCCTCSALTLGICCSSFILFCCATRSEDRNIRVVFFKENLSTGWDCPRAETMMSFKHASDATYYRIAFDWEFPHTHLLVYRHPLHFAKHLRRQEQHYAYVNPVFVIQVLNGSNGKLTDTDLQDCLQKTDEHHSTLHLL